MPRGTKPIGDRAMTVAERQAKRRAQFNQMRDALERILQATKVAEAKEIAAAVLATLGRPTQR
jgi:hypothetical protein